MLNTRDKILISMTAVIQAVYGAVFIFLNVFLRIFVCFHVSRRMQIHFIVIIHKSIDGGKMKFYAVFLANIKHII